MSPLYIPCAWCQKNGVSKPGDLCPECRRIVDEQNRKYEEQKQKQEQKAKVTP